LQTTDVIKPGGRLVVITYHSLEDRIVKNFIKNGKFKGEVEKDFYGNPIVPFKAVNRKIIVPSDNEIQENNRARSAKLRIAERV
jgi:16S rRNA (cytosine1402-N4)-methyltransferase